MPPPIVSLISPTITATAQIAIPPFDFPIIESISPKIANGMPNQLSQPKNGISPIIIKIRDKIPKIRPIVFINIFLIVIDVAKIMSSAPKYGVVKFIFR